MPADRREITVAKLLRLFATDIAQAAAHGTTGSGLYGVALALRNCMPTDVEEVEGFNSLIRIV